MISTTPKISNFTHDVVDVWCGGCLVRWISMWWMSYRRAPYKKYFHFVGSLLCPTRMTCPVGSLDSTTCPPWLIVRSNLKTKDSDDSFVYLQIKKISWQIFLPQNDSSMSNAAAHWRLGNQFSEVFVWVEGWEPLFWISHFSNWDRRHYFKKFWGTNYKMKYFILIWPSQGMSCKAMFWQSSLKENMLTNDGTAFFLEKYWDEIAKSNFSICIPSGQSSKSWG